VPPTISIPKVSHPPRNAQRLKAPGTGRKMCLYRQTSVGATVQLLPVIGFQPARLPAAPIFWTTSRLQMALGWILALTGRLKQRYLCELSPRTGWGHPLAVGNLVLLQAPLRHFRNALPLFTRRMENSTYPFLPESAGVRLPGQKGTSSLSAPHLPKMISSITEIIEIKQKSELLILNLTASTL